jgi:hypothetical protein
MTGFDSGRCARFERVRPLFKSMWLPQALTESDPRQLNKAAMIATEAKRVFIVILRLSWSLARQPSRFSKLQRGIYRQSFRSGVTQITVRIFVRT